jgi:hypothetical protein
MGTFDGLSCDPDHILVCIPTTGTAPPASSTFPETQQRRQYVEEIMNMGEVKDTIRDIRSDDLSNQSVYAPTTLEQVVPDTDKPMEIVIEPMIPERELLICNVSSAFDETLQRPRMTLKNIDSTVAPRLRSINVIPDTAVLAVASTQPAIGNPSDFYRSAGYDGSYCNSVFSGHDVVFWPCDAAASTPSAIGNHGIQSFNYEFLPCPRSIQSSEETSGQNY